MLEEINLINKLLENTIFHKCKSEGINKKGDIIIIINIGITPPPPPRAGVTPLISCTGTNRRIGWILEVWRLTRSGKRWVWV